MHDRLLERWVRTQNTSHAHDAKRIYYLSRAFLMGRILGDSLVTLGFLDAAAQAMHELGYNHETCATQRGTLASATAAWDGLLPATLAVVYV